jgi:mRNA-degrading endonuclease RelE of RelBE toxin-antitoxin system
MKVQYLSPVSAEAIEAVKYYKAIDPKLAVRLTQEFEAAVSRIVHFPLDWKPLGENLRKCTLKGFPYVVIYSVRDDDIVIVAFANTHRRPQYWRDVPEAASKSIRHKPRSLNHRLPSRFVGR